MIAASLTGPNFDYPYERFQSKEKDPDKIHGGPGGIHTLTAVSKTYPGFGCVLRSCFGKRA